MTKKTLVSYKERQQWERWRSEYLWRRDPPLRGIGVAPIFAPPEQWFEYVDWVRAYGKG